MVSSISTLNNVASGNLITIKAQVVNIAATKVVNMQYQRTLKKQEVLIRDPTSSIKVILWESYVNTFTLNSTYIFRASMVTNHKACCQNMTNHQKSKQNFSKTKKYCTKRHEWEGCKSCNYSTLCNHNCYIFRHRQQSDYRVTLISALYQMD